MRRPRSHWKQEVPTYKILAVWSAPKAEDVEAFEQYYRDTHVPLARACPGLRRLVLTRTDRGLEDSEPAFYRVAELLFDDPDTLEESARSPEVAEDARGRRQDDRALRRDSQRRPRPRTLER